MRHQLVQTRDSLTKAHEAMESVLLLQKIGKVRNILFIGEKFLHQLFNPALSQSLKVSTRIFSNEPGNYNSLL